jgi:hypothetical protein
VLGTHGRSLWIFDDLTPIRTFAPAIANKPADLLPPRAATRWRLHGTIGALGRGDNPPAGAIIHFWLEDKPKAKPKLEILDAEGKLVRAVAEVGGCARLNHVLTHEDAVPASEETSLQNVRPSRVSMAWRMRAGTG